MSAQTKKSKVPSGALLVVFGIILAYTHGFRIMDMSEVPSSHRPAEPYLSSEYGNHFMSAN